MKLKISNIKLKIALEFFTSIFLRKQEGILENIMLSAEKQEFKIIATNLHESIVYSLDESCFDILEDGIILINFKKLLELSRKIGSSDLLLSADSKNLCVEGDNYKINIQKSAEHDDYPEIPYTDELGGVGVDPQILSEAIRKIGFIATEEKTRYNLDHIKIEITKTNIKFIATDGKRMAYISEMSTHENEIEFFIPYSAQKLVRGLCLLAQEDEFLKIYRSESKIFFYLKEIKIAIAIETVRFPPYQKIINHLIEKDHLICEKQALQDAILKVLTISDKFSILLIGKNDEVNICAASEAGSGSVTLPAKMEGEQIEITVSDKYILDVLKVLNLKKVKIYYQTATDPIFFVEDNFIYVLLPIKNR